MKQIHKWIVFCLFTTFLLVLILFVVPVSKAANTNGPNNKNVTVQTRVNITNAKPQIVVLTVYQETNVSAKNITLAGGNYRNVTCNASVRDWNGYGDIALVNATLWDTGLSQSDAADDNNTHYTNYNCSGPFSAVNYTAVYFCIFQVYYYANNGSWTCNASIIDKHNKTGYLSNTTIFGALYALNVTDGIDYGNLAGDEYSGNVTANITNFGNMQINVTVQGYGAVLNDGLAMNCSVSGNISIGSEKFSTNDTDWASATTMTGGSQLLSSVTLFKQTVPGTLISNSTYWQLYVDPLNNPAGNCTGNVLFTAIVP